MKILSQQPLKNTRDIKSKKRLKKKTSSVLKM